MKFARFVASKKSGKFHQSGKNLANFINLVKKFGKKFIFGLYNVHKSMNLCRPLAVIEAAS